MQSARRTIKPQMRQPSDIRDFEDWLCVNNHTLAKVRVTREKIIVSAKCHRCRTVQVKAFKFEVLS